MCAVVAAHVVPAKPHVDDHISDVVFNEGGEAFVIAYDDKTRDVVGISEKPEAQPGARYKDCYWTPCGMFGMCGEGETQAEWSTDGCPWLFGLIRRQKCCAAAAKL